MKTKSKPNVLICGFTGAGKTSLIQAVCGDGEVPEDLIGHGTAQTKKFMAFESKHVQFWDSRGFEPGEKLDKFLNLLSGFTKKLRKSSDCESHVHAIWYCIQGIGGRVTEFDLDAIQELGKLVPSLFVVLTKNDITSPQQKRALLKELKDAGVSAQKIFSISQENTETIETLVCKTQETLPDYAQFLDLTKLGEAAARFQRRMERVGAQADEIVNWAAGRAAVIALVPIPLASAIPLSANEAYMIDKLADLYGIDFTEQVKTALVAITGATFTGMALASLVPFLSLGIAPAVTYGVGMAAKDWFASGMTESEEKIRKRFEDAKKKAEEKNWKKEAKNIEDEEAA